MARFDDLIATATHRLRMDRELQLDVQQELRAHLEDAAAEYRDAGYAEDDAADEAAKRFGDAGDLAESIWEANRRRLRWRSVARWAMRVGLPPLMLLAVLAVPVWQWANRVDPHVVQQAVASSDEHLDRFLSTLGNESELIVDNDIRQSAIEQFADLERYQPENAAWLFAGAGLMYVSSAVEDAGKDAGWRIVSDDEAAQARDAIARAASRPRFKMVSDQPIADAIHGLPAPRTAMGLVSQRSAAMSAAYQYRSALLGIPRTTTRMAVQDALRLAKAGNAQAARHLLANLRRLSTMAIADSQALTPMLVGVSMHAQVLEASRDVERVLSNDEVADAWGVHLAELTALSRQATDRFGHASRTEGMLTRMMRIAGLTAPELQPAFAAADGAWRGQQLVTSVTVVAIGLVGVSAVVVGGLMWRRRGRADRPVLVIPRIAPVTMAVAAGLLVGAVIVVWPSSDFSMWILVEGGAAAAALLATVTGLAAWQVRQRRTPAGRIASVVRSAIPLAAFAVLAMVLLAMPILMWQEARAVEALHRSDLWTGLSEVERSPYADLQAWVVETAGPEEP